jgi:hypothetical protein
MSEKVQLCVDAVADGLADGVITYGLDKSAGSTQGMFDPVADAYALFWANHPPHGEETNESEHTPEDRLQNTVTVVGYQESTARYSIAVDGIIEPNPNRGTHTASDSVSGSVADGSVGATDVDSYVYSGRLTAVSLDADAAVYVNGQQVDPQLVGRDSNPQLSNVFSVDGSGGRSRCDYAFTVSDGVAKAPDIGSTEADDTITDTTVDGHVSNDVDAYRFSGRVTGLRMSGTAQVRFGAGD